jgi:hypothetical protein
MKAMLEPLDEQPSQHPLLAPHVADAATPIEPRAPGPPGPDSR